MYLNHSYLSVVVVILVVRDKQFIYCDHNRVCLQDLKTQREGDLSLSIEYDLPSYAGCMVLVYSEYLFSVMEIA